MKLSKKLIVILAIAVAAGLGIAACGGSSGGSPSPSPSPSSSCGFYGCGSSSSSSITSAGTALADQTLANGGFVQDTAVDTSGGPSDVVGEAASIEDPLMEWVFVFDNATDANSAAGAMASIAQSDGGNVYFGRSSGGMPESTVVIVTGDEQELADIVFGDWSN